METRKKQEIENWIKVLEQYDSLTNHDINYLKKNIPKKINKRMKIKIYDLIDNYCLKNTGYIDKDEMEYYLSTIPDSLTCRIYDLKFYISNIDKIDF
jgi:hypothetical protein